MLWKKQRHFIPTTAVCVLGFVLSACLFSTSRGAEMVEAKTSPFAFGAEIGTAGYGPTVIFTLSKHFTATAGYTWLSFNFDGNGNDADYRGKLELSNVQAFVNWHPFAGTFHISAGAFVSRNRVLITGKPKGGSAYDVGGKAYTTAQVGALTGDVELGMTTEPYVGFGWAKKPLKGGVGFFADFGVLFTSSAKTSLVASGPISSDPAFQSSLRKEERDINHSLKPLRYYPIVQAGLLYRF